MMKARTIRLREMNWRDYAGKKNKAAAALMATMGVKKHERPVVKLECMRTMVSMTLTEAEKWAIFRFVDAQLDLDPQEQAVFSEQLEKTMPASQQQDVRELMTSTERKGYDRAQLEIREEVRQRDLRMMIRLLIRELGGLQLADRDRIEALSGEQLTSLGEVVLDFHSVKDLRAWLDHAEAEAMRAASDHVEPG